MTAFALLAAAALAVGFLVAHRAGTTAPAKGDVVLTATTVTPTGQPPSPEMLDQVRRVLLSRMRAAGLARPTVTVAGATVTLTAGNTDTGRLKQLIAPGRLAFRKVLSSTQDQPVVATAPTGPCGSGRSDQAAALASAKAKLGTAYDLAQRIQDPSQVDPQTLAGLAPFANLTCTEVAALPPVMQFLVPTLSCAELNARDPGALDVAEQVVACDQGDDVHTKYYLDIAKVRGTDVAGASSDYDTNNGGWVVRLHFTAAGQPKWTALTQEATQNSSQSQTGQSQNAQVAIVLDDEVVSAPQIQSVIVGDAFINGTGINDVTSKILAAQLQYGVLPVTLIPQSVTTVR